MKNSFRILKTFHFLRKFTHLECQLNVCLRNLHQSYSNFDCHGKHKVGKFFLKDVASSYRGEKWFEDISGPNRIKITFLHQKMCTSEVDIGGQKRVAVKASASRNKKGTSYIR